MYTGKVEGFLFNARPARKHRIVEATTMAQWRSLNTFERRENGSGQADYCHTQIHLVSYSLPVLFMPCIQYAEFVEYNGILRHRPPGLR